ncbi:hypothetical protein EON80_06740 [bacterium]|nr:MAG: hypothetical protein EON80_06740 [bacterium]
MTSTFFFQIFAVLIGTIIATIHGFVCYALCRLGEKCWANFPYFGALLLALYAMAVGDRNSIFLTLVIYAIPGLFGGWFHRLARGASPHWSAAFLLSVTATYLSILLGILTVVELIPTEFRAIKTRVAPRAAECYYFGIIIYPALAPLALWAWQKSRIVPGVDEPFADNR